MQKAIDFLEEYVQWIAIGLGALFVLFMIWTYVVHAPAEVQVGGETLTAGNVDAYTEDHEGKALEQALQNHDHISDTVPSFVEGFKEKMGWKDARPVELAGGMWGSIPQDITLPASANTTAPTPSGTAPIAIADKVTTLPVIPPATLAETKFGRSVIAPPQANGQPAAAPAPAEPGQPAAPAGVNKDWLTQLFKINMSDIDSAFQAAKIPQQFYKTVFLQVEMERQEQLPDGSWGADGVTGKAVAIPPIGVYRQQQPPPPFPQGNDRAQAAVYLQWASANTPDILQPLFYTVIKGDQWAIPGTQAAMTALDPATYTGPLESLSKEQREEVMQARRDAYKKKIEDQQKAHPRTPSGPAGLPGGAAGPAGAPPAFAPDPYYQIGPPRRQTQSPPPFPGANGIFPGAGRGPASAAGPGFEGQLNGGVAGPTPANLPQPGTDYPNGEFDPSQWKGKTVEGWVHDDTVIAGKTYRYRVRYKIKSPVFAAGNVTQPQSLADQFAISSQWTGWGDAVVIPPLVNFFVATGKSVNSNTVWFDVFRWDQGEQNTSQFQVGPGDEVGYEKNGVDYNTKWMVVDFREDPRTLDTEIILVNNEGKLTTRSYKTDRDDPLYNALQNQIRQQKAAAAQSVAAGAPGGVAAPGARTGP